MSTRKAQDLRSFEAADTFDQLPFWHSVGQATVDLLSLAPGQRVLDVCCGTGASAIPAARRVGPGGTVWGVDLSQAQLVRARRAAEAAGVGGIRFQTGDLDTLALGTTFDAVICVFGVFFAEDLDAAARRLWAHVAPGGALAVTSWTMDAMDDAVALFRPLLRDARPDWRPPPEPPWARIADVPLMEGFLRGAGCTGVRAVLRPSWFALDGPDGWWRVVMGSGLRGAVEVLDAAARDRLRRRTREAFAAAGVTRVRTDVVVGLATRDG